jgi:hypothetical protein
MSDRIIDKGQIKIINTLLNKHGLMADKKDIIRNVSAAKYDSTKQLTYDEAAQLIAFLNTTGNKEQAEIDIKVIRMRKKFFAMCFEIGWIGQQSTVDSRQPGKIVLKNDYSAVDNWLLKFGYLHKELNKYTYKELPKLLSQFEFGPYKEYMSKL